MPDTNVGVSAEETRAQAVRRAYLAKIVTGAREKLSLSEAFSAKERWTLLALIDEVAANAEATGIAAVWGEVAAIGAWSKFVFDRALMRDDLVDALGPSVAGGAISAPSTLADLFAAASKALAGVSFDAKDLRDATNQIYSTGVRFEVLRRRPSTFAIVAHVTIDGTSIGPAFGWQREAQLLDNGIPAREAPQLLAALDAMPARTTDIEFEAAIAAKKAEIEREMRERFTPADAPQLQGAVVESGRIGKRRVIQLTLLLLLAVSDFVVASPTARGKVVDALRRVMEAAERAWKGFRFQPDPSPSAPGAGGAASHHVVTPAELMKAVYETTSAGVPELRGNPGEQPESMLPFQSDEILRVYLTDTPRSTAARLQANPNELLLREHGRWTGPLRYAWGIYRVGDNGILERQQVRLAGSTLHVEVPKPNTYLVVLVLSRIEAATPAEKQAHGKDALVIQQTGVKYIAYDGVARHAMRTGGLAPEKVPSGFTPATRAGEYTFRGDRDMARRLKDNVSLTPALAHLAEHAESLPQCRAATSHRAGWPVVFPRVPSRIGFVELQKVACFDAAGDLATWTQTASGNVSLTFDASGTYRCVNMLMTPTVPISDDRVEFAVQSCGETIAVPQ